MEDDLTNDCVVLKPQTIGRFIMRVQRYFENWFWAIQIEINYKGRNFNSDIKNASLKTNYIINIVYKFAMIFGTAYKILADFLRHKFREFELIDS